MGTGGSAAGQGGGSGQAGGDASGGGDGCPDDAKIVYVVDTNNTFSSFDPMSMSFHDIGQLNCPANGGANPFSMAVSRDAFAYVLYDDGEVFKVSTSDLTCTATSFQASLSFTQFGMGFSSDTAGGATDTLFIAGGPSVGSSSTLAHVDVGTFQPSPVGNINGWPELTGTGDAKLWGFFPQVDTSGPAPLVAQLDKTNAHFLTMYEADILGGNANDWAFAFWGGSFWIFLKLDTDFVDERLAHGRDERFDGSGADGHRASHRRRRRIDLRSHHPQLITSSTNSSETPLQGQYSRW